MYQQHYRVPDQPTGYRLEPYGKGLWSVLEPVASTNLITNPSYETALTGSTALSGSETLTRDNTKQRYGNWSLKVVTSSSSQRGMTLNNGGSGFSLTAGKTYTVSVEAWLAGGVPYRLYVTGPSSSTPGSLTITGQGRWMRYVLTFVPTVTGGHNINFIKDASTSIVPWYLDGWLLEALPYATTYLDGDQRGYPEDYIDLNGLSKPSPYQWLGTPHASQSRRLDTTRHGGREWTFDSLGLSVLAYTGAGIPPMNIQDVQLYFGGGSFQRKTKGIRTLALVVAISASGLMSLDRQIAKAQQLLNSDDGPVTLRYQKSDLSPKIDIPVVYESGLESNRDNLYQERTALSFRTYLPIAERGSYSTPLNYTQNIANANSVLFRPQGQGWKSITPDPNAEITSIAYRSIENAYYLGTGTNVILKYDGTTMTGILTVPPIKTIIAGYDGLLYLGASSGNVYRYDGTTFTDITPAGIAQVNALVFAADGSLYAGGANASNQGVILKRNSAGTWTTVLTTNAVVNNTINAMVIAGNALYYGGKFTSITATGTISATNVGAVDLTSNVPAALGSGANDVVYAAALSPEGFVLFGGAFSDIGGIGSRLGAWNGSAWNSYGNSISYTVRAINTADTVYIGGTGTSSGPDNINMLVNGVWTPVDVDLPGTAQVNAIAVSPALDLMVGFNTSGTAKGAVTPVINYGASEATPEVKFYGPGQFYQLKNYTTGDAVYFSNLVLFDGEIATLDLTPGNVNFTSNTRDNLLSFIGPNSNTSTWHLAPGTNQISSFAGGTTNANTAIYMTYSATYSAITEAQ